MDRFERFPLVKGQKKELMAKLITVRAGGFYLRDTDISIKQSDEAGIFTTEEARGLFGKAIPKIAFLQEIFKRILELEEFAKKNPNFPIPPGELIDERDVIEFLGLHKGAYLFRGNYPFSGYKILTPNGKLEDAQINTKYRVRLLLKGHK